MKVIRTLNDECKQYSDGLTSQLEFFHKVDKACLDYLVDKKITHKQ